jgi:hypothetical protein
MAPFAVCANAQWECTMCQSPPISRYASAAFQARHLALRAKGVQVADIAKKLTIKTGVNTGSHPSVSAVYRALADADADADAAELLDERAGALAGRA